MNTSEITKHYKACALWSSRDDSDTALEDTNAELAPETEERFSRDCAAFADDYVKMLSKHGYGSDAFSESRIGHDFWLTRNHHGAGFWDGDWPEPLGKELTDLAHSYGECDLYIGDDGKIYAA